MVRGECAGGIEECLVEGRFCCKFIRKDLWNLIFMKLFGGLIYFDANYLL